MTLTERQPDFCILGAGLAGLSLADSLQENNYEVVVVEKSTIAAGASGTPGGLINPATGRRAAKTWKAEPCYKAIYNNLKKTASFSKEPFYKKNGVLRPAQTAKMARKMKKQFNKTRWPEGWCRWMSEKEIKAFHPGIHCVDGGLWIPAGITVDAGAYLRALALFLESREVLIQEKTEPEIEQKGQCWIVKTESLLIQADHLVFATGYNTAASPYWKDLPLHPVKGQVACFKADAQLLSFEHSISSLGYTARSGKTDEFVQGSTYEHDFSDLQPDRYGEDYLRERLRKTLPQLEENAELYGRWAGVRMSTPDRKPILGQHAAYQNLHIFTGLGSKGLLYGKFLADHYAEHWKEGKPLFKEIDIARIYKS